MRLLPASALLGLSLMLPVTAFAAAVQQPATAAQPSASDAETQFHVMAGEMAMARKQPGLAAREFLAALERVDDVDLVRRATGLAIQSGEQELVQRAAQRWLQIEPNSMDPREVLAQVALLSGKLDEARSQCKAIIEGHAGGVDDAFKIVTGILARGDASQGEAAVQLIRELSQQYPKSAGAQHALAIVALRYRQLELADQASAQAISLAPKSQDEKLLRIGVLVKLHRISDADALVEQIDRKDSQSDDLRLAYAKLLLESEQREAARAQLKKIVARSPKNQDAQFALAVLAVTDGDYAYAEKVLKPMLNGPRSQDAAVQLGRMAELQKQPEAALDYYDRATNGTVGFEAAIRKASLLAKLGRIDEARRMLQGLRARYPQLSTRFTLAETELLMAENRNDEALQVFNEGLSEEPGNGDLLYGRSLVYERLNKIDLAEQDLRAVLEADPDNTRSLNALGYMLTVHSRRYDEAYALIGRALARSPEDAAILDSMGWVEYKRGNGKQARDYLQRAFASFPDGEVAAHLGEVLWSLGEKEQALGVWNEALRKDPNHAVVKETMQRLQK